MYFKNDARNAFDALPEKFSAERLRALLEPAELEALRGDEAMAEANLFAAESSAADQKPSATPQPDSPAAQQMQAPVQAPPAPPPQITIPDTTDAKAVVAGFDQKLAQATAKFNDGELTSEELTAELARLTNEKAEAQARITVATDLEKASAEQIAAYQTSVEKQWNAALDAYQASNAVLWEPEHVAGWDAALRAVTGGPAGEGLTYAQQIAKAHEVYRMNYTAMTGKVLGAAASTIQQQPKLAVSQEQRDPPPQTLAGLNGETASDPSTSTFAAIDAVANSDPIRAEQMIRQLTEAQRDAYLRQYA